MSLLKSLRLRVFGAEVGVVSREEVSGVIFSSFFGDCMKECRPLVVRGSRLFVTAPDVSCKEEMSLGPVSPRLVYLNAVGWFPMLDCTGGRSRK